MHVIAVDTNRHRSLVEGRFLRASSPLRTSTSQVRPAGIRSTGSTASPSGADRCPGGRGSGRRWLRRRSPAPVRCLTARGSGSTGSRRGDPQRPASVDHLARFLRRRRRQCLRASSGREARRRGPEAAAALRPWLLGSLRARWRRGQPPLPDLPRRVAPPACRDPPEPIRRRTYLRWRRCLPGHS